MYGKNNYKTMYMLQLSKKKRKIKRNAVIMNCRRNLWEWEDLAKLLQNSMRYGKVYGYRISDEYKRLFNYELTFGNSRFF